MVCSLEFAPSEFWQMTPAEVFLIIDSKISAQKIGNITMEEADNLSDLHYKLEALEAQNG